MLQTAIAVMSCALRFRGQLRSICAARSALQTTVAISTVNSERAAFIEGEIVPRMEVAIALFGCACQSVRTLGQGIKNASIIVRTFVGRRYDSRLGCRHRRSN